MNKSTLFKVLATFAAAAGVLGFLLYTSVADASRYAMIDTLMATPDRWLDGEMKIHGWVEPGSIVEKVEGQQTRRTFVLAKGGKRIAVKFEGPAPDTFKDQSEVVASGRLLKLENGDYNFEATELMAKCPSKYEGSESNKKLTERPTFQ